MSEAVGSIGTEGLESTSETVIYGKQAEETAPMEEVEEAEKPEAEPEDRRAKFRALASEYKEEYAEEQQALLSRQDAETRSLIDGMKAVQPILRMLSERYGVADGDLSRLNEVMESDDSYYEEQAEAMGMSTEQYRRYKSLEQENRRYKQELGEREAREKGDRQAAEWIEAAAQVKAVYPEFDISMECRNPEFMKMLEVGVPVRHAYEVAHIDDIKNISAKRAADEKEKQVVESIRARGMRPVENGVKSQGGVIIKNDVNKLTKADRAEIARRVERGEIIRF